MQYRLLRSCLTVVRSVLFRSTCQSDVVGLARHTSHVRPPSGVAPQGGLPGENPTRTPRAVMDPREPGLTHSVTWYDWQRSDHYQEVIHV